MKTYINRINAWKHFYPEGNGKAKRGYVLHHIDIKLRRKDRKRYNEWRISDLVIMPRSEHNGLHFKGKPNGRKGTKLTAEHIQKIIFANSGSKCYRARKVLCVNTGEIFDTINEASKKYNVTHSNITSCCQGTRKSAGKLNGRKLVWRYI